MLHEGPCAGAVGSGLAAPDDTEGVVHVLAQSLHSQELVSSLMLEQR